MSSIRITSVPPSNVAPIAIREQWVGVQIPLPTEAELRQDPPSGFKIGSSNDGGYLVLRSKAIEALRAAGKSEAADFWDDFPLGRYLKFQKDVCELIE